MILTVAGFKGGVAKTTTAVHLAAFLADRGKVAVIDGDENRSAWQPVLYLRSSFAKFWQTT